MSTMRLFRSEKHDEPARKEAAASHPSVGGVRASTLSAAERRELFVKAQAKVLERHAPTFRKLAK